VGLTSAELESLNELILIDHIYVKSQPDSPHSKTLSCDSLEDSHIHESSDIPIEMEMHVAAEPPLSELVSQLSNTDIAHTNDTNLFTLSDDSCLVSSDGQVVVKKEIPDDFADVMNPDDIIDALSDSDMEASWSFNFLDELDFDHSSNNQDGVLFQDAEKLLGVPKCAQAQSSNFKLPDTPDVISELNTSKFFSNIEHFLDDSANNSSVQPSSPHSISNSDSDFYSETAGETLSPLGSDVSLLDDLSWHNYDTFTDLFPEIL